LITAQRTKYSFLKVRSLNDATLSGGDVGAVTTRPAAVLMPVVLRESGPTMLLTQRTNDMPSHAGQVAFPGGRVQPEDLDAIDTALRETEEEIGLARGHVDVIGTLDRYVTGTGFLITPVVGLVRPPFVITPDPREVADVFEVPLQFLMTPANHQAHRFAYDGGDYALPAVSEYHLPGPEGGHRTVRIDRIDVTDLERGQDTERTAFIQRISTLAVFGP